MTAIPSALRSALVLTALALLPPTPAAAGDDAVRSASPRCARSSAPRTRSARAPPRSRPARPCGGGRRLRRDAASGLLARARRASRPTDARTLAKRERKALACGRCARRGSARAKAARSAERRRREAAVPQRRRPHRPRSTTALAAPVARAFDARMCRRRAARAAPLRSAAGATRAVPSRHGDRRRGRRRGARHARRERRGGGLAIAAEAGDVVLEGAHRRARERPIRRRPP